MCAGRRMIAQGLIFAVQRERLRVGNCSKSSLPLCFPTESSPHAALDLTELIGVPLPPSVFFVNGFEGYPAYSFGPDANVGRLAKSFIPDPFYYDFAVTVTAKPTTSRGGMLFAVTDAYQQVVLFVFGSQSPAVVLANRANVYVYFYLPRLFTWAWGCRRWRTALREWCCTTPNSEPEAGPRRPRPSRWGT